VTDISDERLAELVVSQDALASIYYVNRPQFIVDTVAALRELQRRRAQDAQHKRDAERMGKMEWYL